MKKFIPAVCVLFFCFSCGSVNYVKNILKERLTVQETVNRKAEMDKSANPAFIFQKTNELKGKRVEVNNAIVQDVVQASHVDYKFCIIVSVPTDKGNIDCYIYAGAGDIFPKEDIKTISKLKKGVTKISAEGDFSRFFTLLDETFAKIEIVNANIDIEEND